MKKIFKWIALLIGILLLLIILALVCLVTFVSPGRFKPLMTEQIVKYTGRQIIIDGNVSWTLFPYLGIKVGHMVLSNPPGFRQKIFAEVEHATVGVRLLPLWHNKIESSGISLDGMKLNLVKDVNGNVNWHFQPPVNLASTTTNIPAESYSAKKPFSIAIAGIDINNATITWTDEQTKQTVDINKFELHAKNIGLLQPFPVTSSFDFMNKSAGTGHVNLSSQISIDVATQNYSFRELDLETQIRMGDKKYNLKIMGDVIADLNQETLQWSNFQAKMDSIIVTGKVSVTELMTNPSATGHLQLQPFDLRQWFNDTGRNLSSLQVFKHVSGDFDFSAAAKSVGVQGKFKVDEIQTNKIKITNVAIPTHYQNGVLNLAKITGSFYQGTLAADAKVDLNNTLPKISMQGKLMSFQAEPLLKDLGAGNSKLKFTGTSNVDLQITTAGLDSNEILKQLNGDGHFSFDKGVLQGIDIAGLINSVKKQSVPSGTSGQTDFGSLTGSFVILNGVMSNNDLLLNSPQFTIKGQGKIDLVRQQIDYHLQTLMNNEASGGKNNLLNLYGIAIPIVITGNLQNPGIGLDSAALTKALTKQQVQKVQSQIQEKIKDNVPGKAGELLKNLFGR